MKKYYHMYQLFDKFITKQKLFNAYCEYNQNWQEVRRQTTISYIDVNVSPKI